LSCHDGLLAEKPLGALHVIVYIDN
jgi:hypothetical protein